MKKMIIPGMLCVTLLFTLLACVPIPVHKCVIDYRFDSCGKKIGEYQECILVDYRTNRQALKHPELLE